MISLEASFPMLRAEAPGRPGYLGRMERRLLRIASSALLAGAGYGAGLAMWYFINAIRGLGLTGGWAGVLAAWALAVLGISAAIGAFGIWTWRTEFKKAAVGLTVAGTVIAYWAVIFSGHDEVTSLVCGVVAAVVLALTALASVIRVTFPHAE